MQESKIPLAFVGYLSGELESIMRDRSDIPSKVYLCIDRLESLIIFVKALSSLLESDPPLTPPPCLVFFEGPDISSSSLIMVPSCFIPFDASWVL